MAIEIPQKILDRIPSRVDSSGGPDDCWPWKLSIGSHGYGQIGWQEPDGRRFGVTAHRAAWTLEHGPIPGDLVVDHLCRNRVCCNPAHLRLLTVSENSALTKWAISTHCRRGHEFTPENTYRDPDGYRRCRECIRAKWMRLRADGTRTDIRLVDYEARPDRYCAECGSLMAKTKRANAKYCTRDCSMRAGRRAYKARKRAERVA